MTYLDIRRQIEATGKYDLSLLMRVALQSARADWLYCKAEGYVHTTWKHCIADALRRAWQVARQTMEYLRFAV